MRKIRPSCLLFAAFVVLTAQQAGAVCGDVTGDGVVSSSDALSVLRAAVGDHHQMMCEPCDTDTTTTLGENTTTTVTTGNGLFMLHVFNGGMGGFMYNGNGRVTSDPAGIDCGNDCSEAYDAGRVVTLTAIADSTSDFVGWRGDVPRACLYVDKPCTLTMSRDLDVWAMFGHGMMQH